jgi:hypothetical protein
MGGGMNQSMSNDPRELLSPEARAQIPEPILDKIIDVLSSSITYTFMWALIPSVIAMLAAFMMTKDRLSESMEYKQSKGE